jgi:S1-C subfamily serine protease
VDPKGKNYINDHSANGTYVNGSRIDSNKDVRVRRSDKISFANMETLDWKKVVRKTSWLTVAAIVAAVIVVGGGIFAYAQGWIFSSEWSLAKTYKTYSNSIACIYHEYRVVAKTDGGKEYVLYLDKQTGELSKMKAGFSQSLGGTAFFIDTEGMMVTNRHVVFPWEADMPQYVQKYKQKYSDDPEVTIAGVTLYIGVAYNNTSISRYSDLEECTIPKKKTNETLKDVALLKVKNPKQLPAKFVPVDLENAFLEARHITIGEPVYVIGYPPVLAASTPEGAMSTVEVKLTNQSGAISQLPDSYKFVHNATAFDGSSGSPIFNNKGQLIGVHYLERPQAGAQIAWGVLVKHAKELYERD